MSSISRENLENVFGENWELLEKEASNFLETLSIEQSIDLSSLLLGEEDAAVQIDIPWCVVFNGDDIDLTCNQLLETAKRPDISTPAYDPSLVEPMRELRQILRRNGVFSDTYLILNAAYRLIQMSGRDRGGEFDIYRDYGRRYPQYAGDWKRKLTRQFGQKTVEVALERNNNLDTFFSESVRLVQDLEKVSPSLQEPDESVKNYIERALYSMEIQEINLGSEDGEGLRRATEILKTRNEPYKIAAYRLRNLI